MIQTMITTMTTATMNSSDGPYHLGIEYLIDADRVCHAILRPQRTERFLGYGREIGAVNANAITVISHDGEPSEWRIVDRDGTTSVARKPEIPPYLGLPDEEHGYSWGNPIALPSSEPARYYFSGREVTESEALSALSGTLAPLSGSALLADELRRGSVHWITP